MFPETLSWASAKHFNVIYSYVEHEYQDTFYINLFSLS